MNREEYRAKEAALLDRWKTVSNQLREIERQRRELKAEYFADNALAIGQAVIFKGDPDAKSPHELTGSRCHVYEVKDYWRGRELFCYSIRKAKKDGTPAQSGRTAIWIPGDQLEAVE